MRQAISPRPWGNPVLALMLALTAPGITWCAEAPTPVDAQPSLEWLRAAVQSGKIAYKLTEPAEISALLGDPLGETTRNDGGMVLLTAAYPDVEAMFGKFRRDKDAPFTLRTLTIQGEPVDVGADRKLILRDDDDLPKLDVFWGFQNVSLVNLDLRERAQLLSSMTFDSLTEWPDPEHLPAGFDPAALLELGKNPGLGLRAIHERGIDGRGVGIAVIDQPLLLGHEEYAARLVRYDATGLGGFAPQMHASPVASIAVGRSIGVAPRATLTYFAVPMWERDNAHYIRALRAILALNQELPGDERIRAVSISSGMFEAQPGFEEWQRTLARAEAAGVLVVTCDPSALDYGTLTRVEGGDPDRPESYRAGRYAEESDLLRVPTGNRSVASHRGPQVYTYEREGGMSWAAPYLAGLAALGFQVDPGLSPRQVVELLVASASETEAGTIVNPEAFLSRVQAARSSGGSPPQPR